MLKLSQVVERGTLYQLFVCQSYIHFVTKLASLSDWHTLFGAVNRTSAA